MINRIVLSVLLAAESMICAVVRTGSRTKEALARFRKQEPEIHGRAAAHRTQ